MFRALIIANETEQIRKLSSELAERGFVCSIVPPEESAADSLAEQYTDLIFVFMNVLAGSQSAECLPQRNHQEERRPLIALVSREALGKLDSAKSVDDFVIEPWDTNEVAVRAKRILRRTNGIDGNGFIKRGSLVIDLNKCEVSAGSRPVMLTFKEYELLKFLAANKGRVFTREALLNRLWGYDYFGGDRTVDVHIRRLRSKLEDSTHNFIETVRNIGYRFRDNV